MQRCASSSGCESRPAQGEPARAGSQPGADLRNGGGAAEAGERVGHGQAAPKPILCPDAEGPVLLEGNNTPLHGWVWARRGPYPAGCATMARTQRTAPYPGRPSPRLDLPRVCGALATRLRRTARCGRTGRRPTWPRTSARSAAGHRHGEPEPWPKEAGRRRAAEERRRRGTGYPPGAGRAQAARVEVSCWRDPWPTH